MSEQSVCIQSMSERQSNESQGERRCFSFTHRDCEYFPCHKGADPENFNCLFCYCPLYMLGSDCGGNFYYNEKGYKVCKNCLRPHLKENAAFIRGQYKKIAEAMAERERAKFAKESENNDDYDT